MGAAARAPTASALPHTRLPALPSALAGRRRALYGLSHRSITTQHAERHRGGRGLQFPEGAAVASAHAHGLRAGPGGQGGGGGGGGAGPGRSGQVRASEPRDGCRAAFRCFLSLPSGLVRHCQTRAADCEQRDVALNYKRAGKGEPQLHKAKPPLKTSTTASKDSGG